MIQLLGDRLLVKRSVYPRMAGSIMLPDTALPPAQEGRVIAVGNGARNKKGQRMPMDVAVGDRVLFARHGPKEVELDGEVYLIVEANDVRGIIER